MARRIGRRTLIRAAVMAGGLVAAAVSPVMGQTSPNGGAIALTGNLDVGTAYFRRGIPQDDTGVILSPSVEAVVAVADGLTVNVGSSNSLLTGDRGRNGPSARLWYASEFHGAVGDAVSGTRGGDRKSHV